MTDLEDGQGLPGNRLGLQRRRLGQMFTPSSDEDRFAPHHGLGYFDDVFDDIDGLYGGMYDDDDDDNSLYGFDDDLISEPRSIRSYTRHRPSDGRYPGEDLPFGDPYRGRHGSHGMRPPHVHRAPHIHHNQRGRRGTLQHQLYDTAPTYGGRGHGFGHGRMQGGYPGMGTMGGRRPRYRGDVTPFSDISEESW